MSRSSSLVLVTLLVSLLAGSPARAADDVHVEQADALAKRAVSVGRAGDFPKALLLFEEAYLLDPAPMLLFNIGRVKTRLGDLEGARESLSAFLEAETDLGKRAQGRAALDEVMERWFGFIVIETVTVGSRVELDGEVLGSTHMTEAQRVSPGEHVVRVSVAGGEPASKTVVVAAGETVLVALAAPAPAPKSPPAFNADGRRIASNDLSGSAQLQKRRPIEERDRTLTWALVATGTALIIAGGVTAIVLATRDPADPSPSADHVWTIERPLEVTW